MIATFQIVARQSHGGSLFSAASQSRIHVNRAKLKDSNKALEQHPDSKSCLTAEWTTLKGGRLDWKFLNRGWMF